ncbi:MAG: cytochrome c biogenesis protein ResB [Dehalococcoidia bacterium]|nr:cytochrome c biogenesis protein ResB [Dehalococcoidia bacterium]
MAAGKGLGESVLPRKDRPLGWSRTFGLLNPLRAVWWLFTNVRFAIFLLVVLSAVSLLGVVIPQVPMNVRGDSVAEEEWLNFQHGRFGLLTDPLHDAGLFDVFHASWFAALMGLTVAGTGAYVISRFPGVWATVTRPRKRVPDRYFQMAPNRLEVPARLDPGRLEQVLRRASYRVERFQEADATYLFADRFQWAQLGSLLTHAAVIVFILAAVVSRVDAFSSPLFLAEGSTLPVFPVKDPNQMQVQLLDAHAAFAPDGRPLDYRSQLVIYRRGEEVLRCQSTVNSPCSYGGYRFYQSAYFGYGAAVQVRDTATGNVIYRETLALSGKSPSPRVLIRDGAGAVLLDDSLVLTDALAGSDFIYTGTLVQLPDGRLLSIGLREPLDGGDRKLAVFEPAEQAGGGVRLVLSRGQSGVSGGLEVSYAGEQTAPSAVVRDFPLPPRADPGGTGGTGPVTLLLANVVYGTDTPSAGTGAEGAAPADTPRLTIAGLQPQAAALEPGQSLTVADREYTFLGQREFSGIQVKRDRSDYLIWAGAALIVAGLMITFWVPRRRFWAKIAATATNLAGQAPGHARYTQELRRIARAAGADVLERTEDD